MSQPKVRRRSRYYTVLGSQKFGDQVHTLIRFRIPEMSRRKRRSVLEAVMDETEADALVECFWTKGSLIHKNQWAFDAILIKSDESSTKLGVRTRPCRTS